MGFLNYISSIFGAKKKNDYSHRVIIKEDNSIPERNIIEFKGYLDLTREKGMEDYVFDLVKDEKDALFFDLSRLEFIDSSGVALFIDLLNKSDPNMRIYIYGASKSVRDSLVLNLRAADENVRHRFGISNDASEAFQRHNKAQGLEGMV